MSTTALDPAQAIAAAGNELHGKLRQLVDRGTGDVDELLDELTSLLRSVRGKVGRARKRAAAEPKMTTPVTGGGKPRPHDGVDRAEPKTAPTSPSGVSSANRSGTAGGKPAVTTPASRPVTPAAAEPKTTTATTRPKPEPATAPKPTPTSTTRPTTTPTATKPPTVSPPARRADQQRPRWLLPALLIAAVLLVALPLTAGWTGLGISSAVAGAAALLTRAHWPRLTTAIRLKIPKGNR